MIFRSLEEKISPLLFVFSYSTARNPELRRKGSCFKNDSLSKNLRTFLRKKMTKYAVTDASTLGVSNLIHHLGLANSL